jgi:hypothetical protein
MRRASRQSLTTAAMPQEVMSFVIVNLLLSALMFAGVLVMIRIGVSAARRRSDPQDTSTASSVNGAVYALLGLLIAFTFAGAAERFSGRRAFIVDEANAIGTAYTRIDLLAASVQPAMRDRFRRYLDTRLETHDGIADDVAATAANTRATALQSEIWTEARRGCDAVAHPACAMLLLPALNTMFDIATTRFAAHQAHPPKIIYGMLIVFAWVSGLLLGHSLGAAKGRHRLHATIYAGVLAVTFFVILDIEYPRQGLIRVEGADQVLLAVRESMK